MKKYRPSRLGAFALAIMGITVASLVSLNFLVDKISQTKNPTLALSPKFKPPKNLGGTDDAVLEPEALNGRTQPKKMGKRVGNGLKNGRRGLTQPPMEDPDQKALPNSAIRARRGKNGVPRAPIERSSRPQAEEAESSPPYPIPNNLNLKPSERELIEQEMERRRRFLESQDGPPPEYLYPPPGFDDHYENEPYEDYNGDYDPDYEGKIEKKTDQKLSDFDEENLAQEDDDIESYEDDYVKENDQVRLSEQEDGIFYEEIFEEDLDYFLEDEYLYDYYEE